MAAQEEYERTSKPHRESCELTCWLSGLYNSSQNYRLSRHKRSSPQLGVEPALCAHALVFTARHFLDLVVHSGRNVFHVERFLRRDSRRRSLGYRVEPLTVQVNPA